MCAKVTEVEHALEDVRELLSQNTRKDRDGHGWEHEWVQIVQDVVEKDAGWKYVGSVIPQLLMHISNASSRIVLGSWMTFWKMVRHALETTAAVCNSASDCEVHIRRCPSNYRLSTSD